jgi:hypothetical protein
MPTRTTRGPAKAATPAAQLASFLAKYTPAVATRARAALKTMRALYPGATQLVYDNYNALAIAFGPTARPGDIVFSVTLYPKWVSLFSHARRRAPRSRAPAPRQRLSASGSRPRARDDDERTGGARSSARRSRTQARRRPAGARS